MTDLSTRLPMIAIVGSARRCEGDSLDRAQAAGRFAAFAGCDLLTGGRGGAMEAAAEAFCTSPHRVGRTIGILPGEIEGLQLEKSLSKSVIYRHVGSAPNPWIEVAVATHSRGDDPRGYGSRNFINILSADLVVALAGGLGTEAEIDIAVALDRPVIALLGSGEMIGGHGMHALPSGVQIAQDETELHRLAAPIIAAKALARPTFAALSRAYNTSPASVHACTIPFPNTCAIRMSEALVQVVPGILEKFKASGHNICPHGYMRGAQDLASVLRRADVFGVYNQGFTAPSQAPAEVSGTKGIICYMNIPSYPDGQGHIDLWDRNGPVGDAYWTGDPIWFWHLP